MKKKQLENPFTPGFGCYPCVIMGRDSVIDEFENALDHDKPGCQDTFPLFSGNRGVGKTVLLDKVENILNQRGFFIYRCNAMNGMTEQFKQKLLGGKSIKKRTKKELNPSVEVVNGESAYKIAGFSFSSEREIEEFDLELSDVILMKLNERNCHGVAIIIDEVGRQYIEELRRIALTVQKIAGAGNRVVMSAAGVSENIDDIEDDETISFTRRMHRLHIDAIDIDEAKDGIKRTLEMNGMEIDDEVLDLMAEATDGYPFIIQRIAYDTWNQAYSRDPEHIHIIGDDFMNATPIFVSRIYESIVRPTIRNLSPTDRAFLEAMSADGGEPSRISDIAERMGRDLNYANTYRARLVRRDVIASIGHGLVVSKIPYLMMYMGNIEAAERLCGLYSPAMNTRSRSREIATENLRKLGYDI